MASKLSLGRSRLSKSVTITCPRPPSFANFLRQMSACTDELVTHTISMSLRLQKNVFGFVGTRKREAGKNARAVVRLLVAIRAEHVIVCTLLVVVLEKVARLRRPLDQLALLELIQFVADLARVLRLSHQEKTYVMKNVVCHEQRDDDRCDQLKRQNNVQGCQGQAAPCVLSDFILFLREPSCVIHNEPETTIDRYRLTLAIRHGRQAVGAPSGLFCPGMINPL